MSDKPADKPAEGAKGKSKLIPMILAVVVLAGAGGGGYYWFVMRPAAAAAAAAKAKAKAEGGEGAEHEGEEADAEEAEGEKEPEGIVILDPFVVNLADPDGTKFLRISLSLLVKGEEEAKEMGENAVDKARIRSALLDLLAQQTSEGLVTPEGKDTLKKDVAKAVKRVVKKAKVSDVLFTEFVVQF